MADHTWIADVLSDLERYLEDNGGTASTAAIVHARQVATEELGLCDRARDLAESRRCDPAERQFRLVVDNVSGT